MRTKLFVTGIAIMALAAFTIAQEPGTGRGLRNGTGKGPAYVDSNNNNVCDNYENNTTRYGRHARVHDGRKAGQGRHAGHGWSQNQGTGRGAGRNFVDADKNGICDNFEAAVKK